MEANGKIQRVLGMSTSSFGFISREDDAAVAEDQRLSTPTLSFKAKDNRPDVAELAIALAVLRGSHQAMLKTFLLLGWVPSKVSCGPPASSLCRTWRPCFAFSARA
eukprot:2836657-Amphidinium_carterae.1